MKTIGLIGGMSWESSAIYYQVVNTVVKESLGGLHSAKCLLYSVDFHEIEACQSAGNWDQSAAILAEAAQKLEAAGADFIVICTNTMHKVADSIQAGITIPVLHIAELTAEVLLKNNISKVGFLGTKYSMEQDFYKSRLIEKGIDVIIPDDSDRAFINATIYDELCVGIISPSAQKRFLEIAEKLVAAGAEGVILGCTEIGLLMKQEDTEISLFDTTLIHAERAAKYAIEGA